jgi:hypothetical protein
MTLSTRLTFWQISFLVLQIIGRRSGRPRSSCFGPSPSIQSFSSCLKVSSDARWKINEFLLNFYIAFWPAYRPYLKLVNQSYHFVSRAWWWMSESAQTKWVRFFNGLARESGYLLSPWIKENEMYPYNWIVGMCSRKHRKEVILPSLYKISHKMTSFCAFSPTSSLAERCGYTPCPDTGCRKEPLSRMNCWSDSVGIRTRGPGSPEQQS